MRDGGFGRELTTNFSFQSVTNSPFICLFDRLKGEFYIPRKEKFRIRL